VKKIGMQATLAVVSVVFGYHGSYRGPDRKPNRIDQAIELLAEGQPIYYTGSHDMEHAIRRTSTRNQPKPIPFYLRLPLQQLLIFVQRQMVEEGIASIDEARDPAVGDGTHDFRVLFESTARVAPGFRASGGTAKTAFNESSVMFSVPLIHLDAKGYLPHSGTALPCLAALAVACSPIVVEITPLPQVLPI
jgi:hypothetical protein